MIRFATPGDAGAVTALAVAAGMFPEDDAAVVDRMMADYFGGNMQGGHVCLIDEQDGHGPLGVAYFLPVTATEGTWELLMIAVRPDRQGQGRGGALLRHVEDDLRVRGGRRLLVQTSGTPEYARTRDFYIRCGYGEEARVRDYYAAGVDMVMFRKVLNSN